MKKRFFYFLIFLGLFAIVSPQAKAAWNYFYGSVTIGPCTYSFNGAYDDETGHGTIVYDGGPCGGGQIWWVKSNPETPVETVADWTEFNADYDIENISGDEDVLLACFNQAASDPNW